MFQNQFVRITLRTLAVATASSLFALLLIGCPGTLTDEEKKIFQDGGPGSSGSATGTGGMAGAGGTGGMAGSAGMGGMAGAAGMGGMADAGP